MANYAVGAQILQQEMGPKFVGPWTEMPTLGVDRVKPILFQDGRKGAMAVIGVDVVATPVALVQHAFEMIVAIEKHMGDVLFQQSLMHLPDLLVRLITALPPVHRGHELFVALGVGFWHMIGTAGRDLVQLTIQQPLLPFPRAPLYDHQHIRVCVVIQPLVGRAQDPGIAAGTFCITFQDSVQGIGQCATIADLEIVGVWPSP